MGMSGAATSAIQDVYDLPCPAVPYSAPAKLDGHLDAPHKLYERTVHIPYVSTRPLPPVDSNYDCQVQSLGSCH